MTSADQIRAELSRAARSLGAPDDVVRTTSDKYREAYQRLAHS